MRIWAERERIYRLLDRGHKLLSYFVVTLMLVLGGYGLFLYFVDNVSPVLSDEVREIRVERSGARHVSHVTRHICAERTTDYLLRQEYRGLVVYGSPIVGGRVMQGCHDRVRTMELPILPNGDYRMEAIYTFCNVLRCREYLLEPLLLRYENGQPRFVQDGGNIETGRERRSYPLEQPALLPVAPAR